MHRWCPRLAAPRQSLDSLDPATVREVRLLRWGEVDPVATVAPGPGEVACFVRRRSMGVSLSGGPGYHLPTRTRFGLRETRDGGEDRTRWY
jgi:hypothetical protein